MGQEQGRDGEVEGSREKKENESKRTTRQGST